jgi:hypothetical protein
MSAGVIGAGYYYPARWICIQSDQASSANPSLSRRKSDAGARCAVA